MFTDDEILDAYQTDLRGSTLGGNASGPDRNDEFDEAEFLGPMFDQYGDDIVECGPRPDPYRKEDQWEDNPFDGPATPDY